MREGTPNHRLSLNSIIAEYKDEEIRAYFNKEENNERIEKNKKKTRDSLQNRRH